MANPRHLIALALVLAVSPHALAEDLLDIYRLAARNDPLIREAEANHLAALEAKPLARGSLMPHLDFTADESRIEEDGTSTFLAVDPITGETVNQANPYIADVDQTTLTLNLRQTVFRWDQWIMLKRAGKEVAQSEASYAAARQGLMVRVARRYFAVLAAKDTLESSRAAREAFAGQLEESEKRLDAGLVAITDVQEAQAAHDQAVADELAARRSLATANEYLREITGGLPGTLSELVEDMPLVGPNPADEDSWVSEALEHNLRLQSSRLAADVARDNVRVRRAEHLPTLDLVASHEWFDSTADEVNDGIPSSPESDFNTTTYTLQLRVPIFSGGRTSSKARQAIYRHRAVQERAERMAREAERQARDAYLGVLSAISQVKALRRAMESRETALRATEVGFRVGTRTTVDVVASRRGVFEARTRYARSRYDYILEVLRLKQAAGSLGEADLREINAWLE